MSIRLFAVGVSTDPDHIEIAEFPQDSGVGCASALVGGAGFDKLSPEAQATCLKFQQVMRDELHWFVEAYLAVLAKSDPNYAMWLSEGAPTVSAGAFSGDYSDVEPEEYREGFVGQWAKQSSN